jgi:hypothetical protein
VASAQALDQVAALWLADIEPTVDPRTFRLYSDTYVAAHFSPFFKTVDRLTSVGVEDYVNSRLRRVLRRRSRRSCRCCVDSDGGPAMGPEFWRR